jgi:hypothetical protein
MRASRLLEGALRDHITGLGLLAKNGSNLMKQEFAST